MILNFIMNLGGIGLIAIGLLYATLLLSALYLILKNERGLLLAFWLVVILSLPFLGSFLYLAKHLLAVKTEPQV